MAEELPTDEQMGIEAPRSGQWPAVEHHFRSAHPACEVCGAKDDLNVHHVRPFHLYRDEELDEKNLITLCHVHHVWVGHVGDFHAWNPLVREDAAVLKAKIEKRPYTREQAERFRHSFR